MVFNLNPAFEGFLDTRSLLLFAVVFLLLFWWTHTPRNLPPGPINWPFVGSFPTFAWQSYTSGFGLHKILTYFGNKYGKICTLNTFGSYMIVISDHQLLKEALNNPKINDRYVTNLTVKVFGVNTITNEHFHLYRRFAMTTFRHFGVGKQSFEKKVATESVILRKEIIKLQGESSTLHGFLNNATANVICSVVFGHRYDYNDDRFKHLMHIANRYNDALGAGGSENLLPILALLPSEAKREMNATEGPIRDFITGIVEEHRGNFDSEHIDDFVDAYLHEQEQQGDSITDVRSFLTDDNMRGNLTTLFIAGADTTSIVIYWGILYLLTNPDIQSRVQVELDSVVGRNRFPRISDKVNLPYTRAVIQEVFRIASPVPLAVLHKVNEDTTIGPYNVPKGAIVVPNIWAIHHDSEVWKDPDEFRPERFINSRNKVPEVIPFSVGRRSCPGEALAQAMVFIFFTHLVHQFTFVTPEGSSKPSMEGELGIVYKPATFMACAVERDLD
ncbi:cytochrome P450 2J4-like [Amphiura filiformis]|uniref:cytochrome P450 2J4-like n=1 Tax=Amphiura filiformis TaxID=82378 RepID=UPI003B222378